MPAYVLGESVLPSIRDWFLSPTGNGDIRPACHRFFGFLIRYSDRTSRSLNGASRPLEQAFELVGRRTRRQPGVLEGYPRLRTASQTRVKSYRQVFDSEEATERISYCYELRVGYVALPT